MKILSGITACTLATVLMGVFAVNFKTSGERVEIVRRVVEVARPISNLLGAASLKQYH